MTAARVFHRIVVPTDFSSCAEEAWALACRLAAAHDAELVLVHVLSEAPPWGEGPFSMNQVRQVFESTREWVATELERRADAARATGLRVRTAQRAGTAWREIVDAAADERADLLVLGTHGRGGFERAVLGSVADRVVRLALCPVLTVRELAPR